MSQAEAHEQVVASIPGTGETPMFAHAAPSVAPTVPVVISAHAAHVYTATVKVGTELGVAVAVETSDCAVTEALGAVLVVAVLCVC